jgi:hypothetical protein
MCAFSIYTTHAASREVTVVVPRDAETPPPRPMLVVARVLGDGVALPAEEPGDAPADCLRRTMRSTMFRPPVFLPKGVLGEGGVDILLRAESVWINQVAACVHKHSWQSGNMAKNVQETAEQNYSHAVST